MRKAPLPFPRLDWLIPLALFLAVLGWWLPWVIHQRGAAALVLLGLDFGDFWKFTNEWRVQGLFRWERLCFFLPPALGAMGFALWLAGQQGWKRWLLLPLPLFLSLILLPSFEAVRPAIEYGNPLAYEYAHLEGPARDHLQAHAREFSFQLRLAALSLLVVCAIPLWQRQPERARLAGIALLSLVGTIAPAYALWRTWLILQGFYGGGAVVGPGVLLTSVSFLATLLTTLPRLAQRG